MEAGAVGQHSSLSPKPCSPYTDLEPILLRSIQTEIASESVLRSAALSCRQNRWARETFFFDSVRSALSSKTPAPQRKLMEPGTPSANLWRTGRLQPDL